MPVPAHRHRETFSHLIGSYGYILYGRVANPLYIDVRLVAHGQSPVLPYDPPQKHHNTRQRQRQKAKRSNVPEPMNLACDITKERNNLSGRETPATHCSKA